MSPLDLRLAGRDERLVLEIQINGKTTEAPPGVTVAGLLKHLDIDPRRVAVEINLDVAPKRTYEERVISAGDQIEIIGFVGGG